MSVAWAQPINGLISAVHIPAITFQAYAAGGMNPGPAVAWSNHFGAPEYDRVDGWNFNHPTVAGGAAGYACVDAQILAPDWSEQYVPPIVTIGVDFSYVTTAPANAFAINWFVGAKMTPPGAALNTYAWTVVGARVNGPAVAFEQVSFGAAQFSLAAWGSDRVLRLRIGRRWSDPGGTDSWLFESILTGVSVYVKAQ